MKEAEMIIPVNDAEKVNALKRRRPRAGDIRGLVPVRVNSVTVIYMTPEDAENEERREEILKKYM